MREIATERLDWNRVRYGRFLQRLLAWILDVICYALFVRLVAGPVLGAEVIFFGGGFSAGGLVGTFVLPCALTMAFWLFLGATPGKLALGLRIVDARTGEAPDLGQWFVRYVGYGVSGFVLGLGYLAVAMSERAQGWHDRMAHTVVVSKVSLDLARMFDLS